MDLDPVDFARGLVLGIFAGGVITIGFNPVATVTFVGVAAMRGILIYLFSRRFLWHNEGSHEDAGWKNNSGLRKGLSRRILDGSILEQQRGNY